MREIFTEYGNVIITIVAVILVIGVIAAVIGNDTSGALGTAFKGLIDNFFRMANQNSGLDLQQTILDTTESAAQNLLH